MRYRGCRTEPCRPNRVLLCAVVESLLAEYLARKRQERAARLTFRIKGQSVVLHPLEIVYVAQENLGERVDSLEDEGDKIISALDELLTRWR